MASTIFQTLPTVDELVNASNNVSVYTAEQILEFSARYARTADDRLTLINYMLEQIDTHGIEAWKDLRWSIIVDRVNAVSKSVKTQTQEVAAVVSGGKR